LHCSIKSVFMIFEHEGGVQSAMPKNSEKSKFELNEDE